MLNTLLPPQVDNDYRGYRLALAFFAVIVLAKILMSVNCIFNGYTVATSADGLPLATYAPACAQTVVSGFAAWGLMQLMLCAVCIAVLVRYRTLIPFMFLVLLLEHLIRQVIHHYLPVAKVGALPGHWVNAALVALTITGLGLSLWRRARLPSGTAPT